VIGCSYEKCTEPQDLVSKIDSSRVARLRRRHGVTTINGMGRGQEHASHKDVARVVGTLAKSRSPPCLAHGEQINIGFLDEGCSALKVAGSTASESRRLPLATFSALSAGDHSGAWASQLDGAVKAWNLPAKGNLASHPGVLQASLSAETPLRGRCRRWWGASSETEAVALQAQMPADSTRALGLRVPVLLGPNMP
jgi:hypothetical protein